VAILSEKGLQVIMSDQSSVLSVNCFESNHWSEVREVLHIFSVGIQLPKELHLSHHESTEGNFNISCCLLPRVYVLLSSLLPQAHALKRKSELEEVFKVQASFHQMVE
jgi:hypothetical protein